MSVTRLHPTKSNTLYSEFPYLNVGKDQIIELTSNKLAVSRIIMDFSKSEINQIISGSVTWNAKLKLYAANESGLPGQYQVDVLTTFSDWKEGTGNYLNYPNTVTGSNWVYTNSATGAKWIDSISGSISGSYNPGYSGGGNWYTTPSASTLIDKNTSSDLYLDVTDNIKKYLSGSSSGLTIKLNNIHESNYNESMNVKYFSEDTNTIYKPVLEIIKFDNVYVPSGSVATSLDLNVSIFNSTPTLTATDIVEFKVGIKKAFVEKSYSTVYSSTYNLVVPTESYWQLRDQLTGEVVIEGSAESTSISTQNGVNYFTFNAKNLYKNRYYTFDIFIKVGNNLKKFTPKYIFSIVG